MKFTLPSAVVGYTSYTLKTGLPPPLPPSKAMKQEVPSFFAKRGKCGKCWIILTVIVALD